MKRTLPVYSDPERTIVIGRVSEGAFRMAAMMLGVSGVAIERGICRLGYVESNRSRRVHETASAIHAIHGMPGEPEPEGGQE